MTIKLALGVVLVALYLLAWAMAVLLGLELRPPRWRDPMPLRTDGDGHANKGTNTRQTFNAEDDVDGEGARPSSLLPYHHHKPDRAYLLQLKYAMEIANEETVRRYGPLPPGGLPVQKKTKPKVPYRDFQGNLVRELPAIEENDEMKIKCMATVAAMAVGAAACHPLAPVEGASHTGSANLEGQAQSANNPAPPTGNAANPAFTDLKPTNGSLGPEYRKIGNFVDFRKKLLADGWQPVANADCHNASLGADEDGSFCKMVPETAWATGTGYYVLRYVKNGTPLAVTIYGDIRDLKEPGKWGLGVSRWEYTTTVDDIPMEYGH
ncbi:hypothetical protein GCM10010981_13350 [Dyella nitratireducens]|uniref:Uncharacterized protein n=2 Tax=Dyella nitratireducens TaxID=1849580 RepID=A0ABQ1FQG4_9GAMM|nr:hypothetical protein GCM10010981_13350 [Dyella nitratireducens]GLQ43601.1 hypothetical protein GCM10007902_34510 [Dyella nitratireducens]